MGLAVSIAQAFGLIAMIWTWFARNSAPSKARRFYTGHLAVTALSLLGLWNIAWYGMRNVETFWGQAAVITGVIMLLGALQLSERRILLPKLAVFIGLIASFTLYAVTIVRLNLGLPIIN